MNYTSVVIKLVIKVMDSNSIFVIIDRDEVPYDDFSPRVESIQSVLNGLGEKYGIHKAYNDPKLVDFYVDKTIYKPLDAIIALYTVLTPKEYINEEARGKMANNFEKLSDEDRLAIRQSLQVLPY